MKHTVVAVGVLTIGIVVSGCGSPAEGWNEERTGTSKAALGSTLTTTAQTGVVCNESTAFALFADVTYPSSVAPGESFPFSAGFRLAVPQRSFGLTFVGRATLAATAATPTVPMVSFPLVHFEDNDFISDLGTSMGTLTAASVAGAPIVVRLDKFDYTITPDDPTDPHVNAHCTALAEFPDPLFTIPIVLVPRSKDDCKQGGYATHTDDAGLPFKNQGACIKYVHGTG